MLRYATTELPGHAARNCTLARRPATYVDQHFRSQLCFCGFELAGMANRTHLAPFGNDEAVARLATVIPDAASWNRPRSKQQLAGLRPLEGLATKNHVKAGFHTTGTRDHARHYAPALLAALEAAVAGDLAFFRARGLFL